MWTVKTQVDTKCRYSPWNFSFYCNICFCFNCLFKNTSLFVIKLWWPAPQRWVELFFSISSNPMQTKSSEVWFMCCFFLNITYTRHSWSKLFSQWSRIAPAVSKNSFRGSTYYPTSHSLFPPRRGPQNSSSAPSTDRAGSPGSAAMRCLISCLSWTPSFCTFFFFGTNVLNFALTWLIKTCPLFFNLFVWNKLLLYIVGTNFLKRDNE